MGDELFNLYGTLGVDDKGLDSGLKRAEQKIRTYAERTESFLKKLNALEVPLNSKASKDRTDDLIKAGAAIGGVSAGFTAASSVVKLFRGDMDGFSESLTRLPFGIGKIVSEMRNFADVLEAPSRRLRELLQLTLELTEKTSRFQTETASLFGDSSKKIEAKYELEMRAIGDKEDAAFKAAGIDQFRQGLNPTEKQTEEAIRAMAGIERQRALFRKMEAEQEMIHAKQIDMYRRELDAQRIRDENKAKRKEEEEDLFNKTFDGPSAKDINKLLIDEGAEMVKKEFDKELKDFLEAEQKILDIENQVSNDRLDDLHESEKLEGVKAQEFNARMFAGGITGTSERDQPKAKQIDKTNSLLSEIIRKVGVQAAINVVAQ